MESGYASVKHIPWERLGYGLFVVLAIVGMLALRARLTRRSDAKPPQFPKKRSILHEKGDVSSSAKPCATNSGFEYQLPDMLTLGNSNSYFYDQPNTNYPEPGPGEWKQEPVYVHPTAPDNLPIELWYPGELPPKDSALQYSESFDSQTQASQEHATSNRMANQTGQPANINAFSNGSSLTPERARYDTLNSMNGLASMDQLTPVSGQLQMSQSSQGSKELGFSQKGDSITAPPPTRPEPQHQNSWQKSPQDPLSDLETVLFNDPPTQPRAPILNHTPPSETVVGGQVWNSPPDSFHAASDNNSPHLEIRNPGSAYSGSSHLSQSPLLDFNMTYTEEPSFPSRQFSIPAPLHMQKNHPHKIHKQPLTVHHAASHHAHHVSNQRQTVQPYNLPSPPHSARGSSESGSDTNDEHAFKCPNCSASFRIRGYLTRHMKKHAEIMKFNCPFYSWLDPDHKCHQTGGFSRRDTFKMHLKARHFAYPTGTARKNRPNCAGRCCGCGEHFENNEQWIETHLLAGECPMDKACNSHDPDSSY